MVVAVGLTLVDPLATGDVNVPGVMAILVAPVVCQLSVLPVPELMLVGVAVKEVIASVESASEDEFDCITELQLASPTQANRISPSPEARSAQELSPTLKNEPAECMRSPWVVLDDIIVATLRPLQSVFQAPGMT